MWKELRRYVEGTTEMYGRNYGDMWKKLREKRETMEETTEICGRNYGFLSICGRNYDNICGRNYG